MLCPICKKKILAEFQLRPFCSLLCANKDLLAWLSEDYYFPSQNEPPSIETSFIDNNDDKAGQL